MHLPIEAHPQCPGVFRASFRTNRSHQNVYSLKPFRLFAWIPASLAEKMIRNKLKLINMLVTCSKIGPHFASVYNILGYLKGAKTVCPSPGVYRTGLLPKVITPRYTEGRRIYVPD